MSGESFFSRILSAIGLKSSYESKHKTAYERLDYKHLIPASVKGKCGYVSEFGEWIIEPQYDKCGLFADNGLAPIEVNEKFGYIDKTGSYVIKPTKFDWASPFGKNGLAVVSVDGHRGWMDSKCNFVIEPKYDEIVDCENGYAVVSFFDEGGGTWQGIVDDSGKTIIEPMPCELYGFAKNGLAAIRIDDKYGYIDTAGKMVIEPQFFDVENFGDNGLAVVEHNGTDDSDGMYGLIDKTGNFVIEPKYDLAFNCPNGMVSVYVDGKYGCIDISGKTIVEPKYDDFTGFNANGIAAFSVNKKWGVIDDSGKIITEPIYDFDSVVRNDNGWFDVVRDNKFGLMNPNGELLIKLKYDQVLVFEDVMLVQKKKWGIVDVNDNFIAPPQFDWLVYDWLA